MQEHIQTGQLYLEFLRESCASTEQGGFCDYCQNTDWQGPVMERIPRPFPDYSKEGHYLDVFSTPNTNEDGSPREIDDFLPRARVKELFAQGEIQSSNISKLEELSKELCVPVGLLEDSVKHCEELKVYLKITSGYERGCMKNFLFRSRVPEFFYSKDQFLISPPPHMFL